MYPYALLEIGMPVYLAASGSRGHIAQATEEQGKRSYLVQTAKDLLMTCASNVHVIH